MDIIKEFVVQFSGAAVMLIAFSSYLGKIWARIMLSTHKAKLDRELEGLKRAHQAEIERYKTELKKARSDYNRYSSKKFEIIEETWTALFNVVQELKLYNPNEGNYLEFLKKTIRVISSYLTLVKKNSLYFDDGLMKLLNDYISVSSRVVTEAGEKIEKMSGPYNGEKIKEIVKTIYNTATEREKLLSKIKQKFRKELSMN